MIGHSILFNVLPLAVHGLPVRALTFRPIPPRGPTRKVSLSSRQPSTANLTLPPTGTWCRACEGTS